MTSILPFPSHCCVPQCKTLTSGLESCSPPQQPTHLHPCTPHLQSLFRMILIDSFIDCKEIGCSYNTAGLVGVMKKGIWLWACCTQWWKRENSLSAAWVAAIYSHSQKLSEKVLDVPRHVPNDDKDIVVVTLLNIKINLMQFNIFFNI